jgi:hypothetical protein
MVWREKIFRLRGDVGIDPATPDVMPIEWLRERIREGIRAGLLPCHPAWQTWAGPGTGRQCSACTLDITVDNVEYEVEVSGDQSIFVHIACYQCWVEECHARLAGE